MFSKESIIFITETRELLIKHCLSLKEKIVESGTKRKFVAIML